ncbi:MAG: hypothetical protein ACK5D8_06945, partial [Bacteroidota bacterium]
MEPLLIYLREEYLELWSIDNNGRVLPVNFQSSNKVPLYFIQNGDQIEMDDNAKQQYLNNNSFGDFWKNMGNKSLTYTRFQKSFLFDTLLPYAMKESVLPEVLKSHFHSSNFSEFIAQKRTFLLFDSFVEEKQREVITKGFLEIIGFAPNNLTILDFWGLFRSFQKTNEDPILFVNASLGNIYIHLIGGKHPFHVSKKIIEGKGRDPRVDTILDFVIDKAIARGSGIAPSELKNIIASEASIILSKLPNGFVQHTISNNKLDVNPLRLDFNAQEVESRLSNKQSLNYIQNEFEEFRRNNNANQLSIYLNGSVINQEVFLEFFRSTYNKVKEDNVNTSRQFLEYVLNNSKSLINTKVNSNIHQLGSLSSQARNISHIEYAEKTVPISVTPPVVSTPPIVNTPPVVTTPPVVKTPPKATTPPVVKTPPKVTLPPVVKVPPVPTKDNIATTENKPEVKGPPIIKPEVKVPPVPNKINIKTSENKPELKKPPTKKPEMKVPPILKDVKKVNNPLPPPLK